MENSSGAVNAATDCDSRDCQMVHNHGVSRSEIFLVVYPGGRLVAHTEVGTNREERVNKLARTLLEYDFPRGKAFSVYLVPDTPLRDTPRLCCTIGLNDPYVVVWSGSGLRDAP